MRLQEILNTVVDVSSNILIVEIQRNRTEDTLEFTYWTLPERKNNKHIGNKQDVQSDVKVMDEYYYLHSCDIMNIYADKTFLGENTLIIEVHGEDIFNY